MQRIENNVFQEPRCFLSVLDPLIVNGKEIETVDNVKLLGVTMSSDLTWNAHIEEVIKKANKRLYFLVQLKRAKVPLKELVLKEGAGALGEKSNCNYEPRNS